MGTPERFFVTVVPSQSTSSVPLNPKTMSFAVSNHTGLLFDKLAEPIALKFPPVDWYSCAFDTPLMLATSHLLLDDIFSNAVSPLNGCAAIEALIAVEPKTLLTFPSEQNALSILEK